MFMVSALFPPGKEILRFWKLDWVLSVSQLRCDKYTKKPTPFMRILNAKNIWSSGRNDTWDGAK